MTVAEHLALPPLELTHGSRGSSKSADTINVSALEREALQNPTYSSINSEVLAHTQRGFDYSPAWKMGYHVGLEQGLGDDKSFQDITNPFPEGTREYEDWHEGNYEGGMDS